MKTKLSYDYEHYASTAELPEADRTLVAEAERATRRSHAPYSKFRVGAAARLASGKVLHAGNFESEVTPRGCAPNARCSSTSRPTFPTIRSRRSPSPPTRRRANAIPAASAGRSWSTSNAGRGGPCASSCRAAVRPARSIRPRNSSPSPSSSEMFSSDDILYEDNHLLVVNKRCGDLVQPDPSGQSALEDQIKAYIKRRDAKPGEVFLGVVHRIDRPVSGAVLFAKTSKALVRLNEMIRSGEIRKTYWAVTEQRPDPLEGELRHWVLRDGRTNRSRACDAPKPEAKEARLRYRTLGASTNYTLVEVELLTGRHHQIRAQLSKIGCPIKGDLKYGARRSNPDGGISLHSRAIEFTHPVRREPVRITAPVPAGDNLWAFFARNASEPCAC